ncbi:shikimate dehydrogenase [Bifidobacterium aemilianum]|uniref:Shikimate dehydrogenase n=1 Tax=Bifidobacterium aemilianum TaxID=2493120 RepID=A0A366K952_9BIFI|nr:shikimate dehydrogenase [Bifidobacterium aemilianum]RBP98265.1 shikimate dehydrogenase [Bifidobacterium aemilianum]
MISITHHCAVLGSPISHSLSPLLHEAAYKALGLDDWAYNRQEVTQADLPAFVQSLDPSWVGLSLTMPLKQAIVPYGQAQDPWAKRLRVANTAVFDWGSASQETQGQAAIRLYNTDVAGIALAFRHAWQVQQASGLGLASRPLRAGGTAVILGNGNTAQSALAALASLQAGASETLPGSPKQGDPTDSSSGAQGADVRPWRLVLAARHPDSHPDILDLAGDYRHVMDLNTVALHDEALTGLLADADVVISTLPAHAADSVAESLAASGHHLSGSLLDVAYDPRPSLLNRVWDEGGGLSIGGEEMLLYQALIQLLVMLGPRLPEVDRNIDQATGAAAVAAIGPDLKTAFQMPYLSDRLVAAVEQSMRAAIQEAL